MIDDPLSSQLRKLGEDARARTDALTKAIAKEAARAGEFAQMMGTIGAGHKALLEGLALSFQPLRDAQKLWAESLERSFQPLRDAQKLWAKQFSEMAKQLGRISPEARNAALSLGGKGWTVPSWEVPGMIRTLAAQSGSKLDKYYLRHYSKDRGKHFRALSEGLQRRSQFQRWVPLLRQAQKAYLRRDYLVVVPCLLLVIEGCLATAVNAQHRLRRVQHNVKDLEKQHAGIARLACISLVGWVEHTFATHPFSQPPRAGINRHWILHGRSDPAWGKLECLQLFQALDTLGYLWR